MSLARPRRRWRTELITAEPVAVSAVVADRSPVPPSRGDEK